MKDVVSTEDYNYLKAITLRPRFGLYRAIGKRLFDISLVLLSLPLVLPIIGIVALLVVLTGGKPFYRQNCVGRNGRIFRMWHLRTMSKEIDASLEQHERHDWQFGQDPVGASRLTRLGSVLRDSSLDELPRLFNVLIGDMSFVGPRPMTVSQKTFYPGEDYSDLRPGLTGLWQTYDLPHRTLVECTACDSRYGRSLSLFSDVVILIAAFNSVLRTNDREMKT